MKNDPNPLPREKLMARGAQSLEDHELLAVLLGSGVPGKPVFHLAGQLLDEFGGISGIFDAPWEELRKVAGIGLAKFAAFQAARELCRRIALKPICEQVLTKNPENVSNFMVSQLGGRSHEVFAVLFMDSRHRLIRFEIMFRGTLTQTSVHPREIAKRCLQLNASAVIVAHNHPSGIAEPSRADVLLTTGLKRSLATLDIELLDHLLVAGDRTVSIGSGLT